MTSALHVKNHCRGESLQAVAKVVGLDTVRYWCSGCGYVFGDVRRGDPEPGPGGHDEICEKHI